MDGGGLRRLPVNSDLPPEGVTVIITPKDFSY